MKSKGTAYVLWLLSIFGWLGFHRFYLGKPGTGIIWILTGGVAGVGALIDLFTLGGQVEQYNTNNELKTLRTTSMANQTALAHQTGAKVPEPPRTATKSLNAQLSEKIKSKIKFPNR